MQGQIKKSRIVMLFGIGLVLMMFVLLVVRVNADYSREIDVSKIKDGEDRLTYGVEIVDPCDHKVKTPQVKSDMDSPYWVIQGNGNYQDYIDIKGWCIERNQSIELFNTKVILKETKQNGETAYKELKTQSAVRSDINEQFQEDGCDYNYSGFLATIARDKISAESEYEICILYMNNEEEYLVETGQMLG